MTDATHRRMNCFTLMLAATTAGLLWRMGPLHLPYVLFKYGGSCLWAVALYFLLAALMPRTISTRVAILGSCVSTAVEFSRLLHTPGYDAFLRTLVGRLLIGRYFSPKNLVAYWLAIAIASACDAHKRSAMPRA